jgi:hypothetical protein
MKREFLQNVMLAASALALDPERLLWVPGQTVFIPKKTEVMQWWRYETRRPDGLR